MSMVSSWLPALQTHGRRNISTWIFSNEAGLHEKRRGKTVPIPPGFFYGHPPDADQMDRPPPRCTADAGASPEETMATIPYPIAGQRRRMVPVC